MSVGSRRVRSSMWSALQATVLFAKDPKTAAGEADIDDGDILAPKEKDVDAEDDAYENSDGDEKGHGLCPAVINRAGWRESLACVEDVKKDDVTNTTDGADAKNEGQLVSEEKK